MYVDNILLLSFWSPNMITLLSVLHVSPVSMLCSTLYNVMLECVKWGPLVTELAVKPRLHNIEHVKAQPF